MLSSQIDPAVSDSFGLLDTPGSRIFGALPVASPEYFVPSDPAELTGCEGCE
jgi:hypothetical protein